MVARFDLKGRPPTSNVFAPIVHEQPLLVDDLVEQHCFDILRPPLAIAVWEQIQKEVGYGWLVQFGDLYELDSVVVR